MLSEAAGFELYFTVYNFLYFCNNFFQTSGWFRISVMEYQIGNFFILNLAILFSYWQKTRFICYITLICCELNFFVLAGWAGTAKKICNFFSSNWHSHKSDSLFRNSVYFCVIVSLQKEDYTKVNRISEQ